VFAAEPSKLLVSRSDAGSEDHDSLLARPVTRGSIATAPFSWASRRSRRTTSRSTARQRFDFLQARPRCQARGDHLGPCQSLVPSAGWRFRRVSREGRQRVSR
jgi:hypothetical protein